MYGVQIVFDNGHERVIRLKMRRNEYCDEMRKWEDGYDLKIERVETFKNGNTLIFYNAYERKDKPAHKNMEKVKSRAKYCLKNQEIAEVKNVL